MRYFYVLIWLLTLASGAGAAEIGQMISEFSSKTAEGGELSLKRTLASHRGLLVVFVGAKCPYSNQYNDRFRELAASLKDKGVAFVAVNSNANEGSAEIKKHAKENRLDFPILLDPDAALADRFGAQKTPETYLLSKEGKLLYQGRIDDDTEGKQIRRRDALVAVEEYLAGKSIRVPKTKAFGCTIERN